MSIFAPKTKRLVSAINQNKNKMRNIKFRGFSKKEVVPFSQERAWVVGNLLTEGGTAAIHNGKFPVEVVPETVGQFTGLTDKNGKEIYEGDIATDGENIYTVEFSMWSYAFVWNKHGSQNNFHFEKGDNQEMELVGNIYDNPELRTKTKMK